ncbi:olfactomedin-like protein 2B [Microcaecilia unicolor]|uniref:Olfactomedin-like protein 2B n=1 Tax=Microcaecilia unicolor TaxID=1415580 RepID=A0A6P7Y7K4_9AMPH|nr:olfactomedin-like protein 2B [Microcaecilia unicolor]
MRAMCPLLLLLTSGGLLSWGSAYADDRAKPTVQTPGQQPAEAAGQASPELDEEILENEADNQENILSQLLGDYEKVKAVSQGSNCQCKCVVKPMSRNACQRFNDGSSKAEDFYTVETITSGSDCKCACFAPPSALNPCEGDFRLKKLRETETSDFKLSSIIELLEGAFYGLDLLKLHSVTTKIIGRVDKIEEVISQNLTKEHEHIKGEVDGILSELKKKDKENCTERVLEERPEYRRILQRDAAAAYTHNEEKYEERFLNDAIFSHHGNAIPRSAKNHQAPQGQPDVKSKAGPRPGIIRGITYYKAQAPQENDIEEEQDELFSGDHSIDMLIEDQFIRLVPKVTRAPSLTSRPSTSESTATQTVFPSSVTTTSKISSATVAPTVQSLSSAPTQITFQASTSTPITTVNQTPEITTAPKKVLPTATTSILPTTSVTTEAPLLPVLTSTIPASTTTQATSSNSASPISTISTGPSLRKPAMPSQRPEDQKEEEDDLRKVIGRCKETLSTISGPTIQNTYGRNEGAWMKDPLAKDEKIYIANYYYGNTLVEFRNLESFKQGRWSNSYKLPYHWIGTGHAVYNGSFYYNRAFTRNIIKYDLKQRYVAAWAMLHDVIYEDVTPWRWRGHSDIDFAVDENGLWVIYPAFDDEGFQQDVIVLSKVNEADLGTRKETTWRTSLRKSFYGNCFVICGVLYAVDSYNKRNANISYAFDTHTNTQIIPRLLFENEYSYTTQIDYNPKDRLLYAWDNGHQVTYRVIFAY